MWLSEDSKGENGVRNEDCCRDKDLSPVSKSPGGIDGETMQTCMVCGRRWFTSHLPAVDLGSLARRPMEQSDNSLDCVRRKSLMISLTQMIQNHLNQINEVMKDQVRLTLVINNLADHECSLIMTNDTETAIIELLRNHSVTRMEY